MRTGRKLLPFQQLESQVVKGEIFVGGCSCASSAGEITCLGLANGIQRGLLGWKDGLGLPGGLQGEGTRLGPGDGCRGDERFPEHRARGCQIASLRACLAREPLPRFGGVWLCAPRWLLPPSLIARCTSHSLAESPPAVPKSMRCPPRHGLALYERQSCCLELGGGHGKNCVGHRRCIDLTAGIIPGLG